MRNVFVISLIAYLGIFAAGFIRSVTVEHALPSIDLQHTKQIQALLAEGKIDEAKPLIEILARLAPDDDYNLMLLARIYYQSGENEAFLKTIKQIQTVAPNHLESAKLYASFLMENDRAEEAAKIFDKVLALNPMDYEALNSRGVLYLRSGSLGKAKRYFEKVLEINEDYELARKNLDLIEAHNRRPGPQNQ